MADVTIKYKDSVIAEMDDNGSKTLNTSGCYCEDNVVITYTPRAVADDSVRHWDVTATGENIANRAYFLQEDWLKTHRADANLCVAIIPKFTIVHDSTKTQLGIFFGMNGVWGSNTTANYKTISAYVNKSGSMTPRLRTFGMTDGSDIGDVFIDTEGKLGVIVTASNPLAPGEYCVMAWLK